MFQDWMSNHLSNSLTENEERVQNWLNNVNTPSSQEQGIVNPDNLSVLDGLVQVNDSISCAISQTVIDLL